MKVLIVDSVQENRNTLRTLLQSQRYEAIESSNGSEALDIAQVSPPDLVVCALHMPEMDGFALCRAWRDDDDLNSIPFVFCTSTYTQESHREFGMALGADRFLCMPMDDSAFLLEIRQLIDRGEVSRLSLESQPLEERRDCRRPETSPAEGHDSSGRLNVEQEIERRTIRLQKVSELSMTLAGDPLDVFEKIAQIIGELLEIPVVCLSQIDGDTLSFLSVYVNGEVTSNAGSCSLEITPCATVQQDKEMKIYEDVAKMFPKASFLKTHNACGYCGFPSLDNNGNVIAVTCLLSDAPQVFSEEDKGLLTIFGQRIGMELERQKELNKRKAAEVALQKAHDELEDRVERRTAELQESNEELEAFAYSVSHDLRAPLRAIEGFAEALKEDYESTLDDVAQGYLKHITGGAVRMGQLINDLLEHAKLGRNMLAFGPVSMPGVVDHVQSLLAHQIQYSKATIHVDENLPTVEGHRGTLELLMQNLLQNAMKFVEYGRQPKIAVSAVSDDKTWQICVRDNGIGIAERFQNSIFDIFQRLHTDDAYPGTGIGLAIVKKAALLHGGEVWVESKEGEGSAFWVKLPKKVTKRVSMP
ncbi:MAG: response regulator [Planctomycetales bacterium]|nr:response regulator [Planctomycetales bacterium]